MISPHFSRIGDLRKLAKTRGDSRGISDVSINYIGNVQGPVAPWK